jgi:hypothetical protein
MKRMPLPPSGSFTRKCPWNSGWQRFARASSDCRCPSSGGVSVLGIPTSCRPNLSASPGRGITSRSQRAARVGTAKSRSAQCEPGISGITPTVLPQRPLPGRRSIASSKLRSSPGPVPGAGACIPSAGARSAGAHPVAKRLGWPKSESGIVKHGRLGWRQTRPSEPPPARSDMPGVRWRRKEWRDD